VSLANAATGTFAQVEVDTNIVVSTAPMSMTGADIGNYTLMQPSGLEADITFPEISATHGCDGYRSSSAMQVTNLFAYPSNQDLAALTWTVALPTDWILTAAAGDGSPLVAGTNIVFADPLTNRPMRFAYTVWVPAGQAISNIVSADVSFRFASMVGDGLTAAVTPDPLWLDIHHGIDASADAHGWISPSGVVAVIHGGSANFDMGAETYYHISNVFVDTVPVGETNSYGFADVTSDHTIALFTGENLACRGTPEWWLALHRLTNATTDFCAAETNDTDGDVMPAWQEWVADTIPTNADSVLSFVNINRANDDVKLEWKGGTSAWQSLQIRCDLVATTEQWLAVFTNEPPTSGSTNYLHEGVTNRVTIYRLRAWR